MKTIIYRVFVGNKWTSTLIIFSVLAFLMILWTIAEDGPRALDLMEPTEFVLRMLLPIVFSILYLVYRFVNDGKLTPKTLLRDEAVVAPEETKKSIANLIAQVFIISAIAVIPAFVLYFYLLFSLTSIGIPEIIFVILGIPTFVFWLYKSTSYVKQAHNQGVNIPLHKKFFVMLLAFLSCYFFITAYYYINYKIYERERAIREAQQLAEVVEKNQQLTRANKINQPTFTIEKTAFYSPVYGDTPVNECNEITSDPLHQDVVFESTRSFYCEERQWTAYPALFYRFLYERGGTYKSPTFENTSFNFTVPENWLIDEELVLPQNEDGEWLRIGVYTVDDGKITLSSVGIKVFYRTTSAKNFDDLVEEIKAIYENQQEEMNLKIDNSNSLGKIILTRPDYTAGGTTNDLYIFVGPSKYLLFQNAYDFIVNSLEKN